MKESNLTYSAGIQEIKMDTETINKLKKAVCMLSSMIECGDSHSTVSRAVVKDVLQSESNTETKEEEC